MARRFDGSMARLPLKADAAPAVDRVIALLRPDDKVLVVEDAYHDIT